MEEDIKRLEELIKPIKIINYSEYETPIFIYKINKLEREAIENLIKRNKELEEENSLFNEQVIAMNVALLESIPKEKLKKEIEELEKVKDYKPLDNRYTYKEVIEFGIKELQQLL